jgi:hypothetical protein
MMVVSAAHCNFTAPQPDDGPQPQNFRRDSDGSDAKIEAVLSGDLARVKTLGPAAEVIGDISRGMIVAAPGHRLLIGDFTGIESIVLAYIAGQQSKLDEWMRHIEDARVDPDNRDRHPYAIIGKSLGITDKDEAYRIGKICDLAFGYLGGLKAYRNFAPAGDTSTDAEIYEKRNAWQARHPKVVEFWHGFNNLAVNAVQKPNVPFGYNKIKLVRTADFLHVQLPSGRFIHYPDPRITNTTRHGEDAVIFKDNAGGRWGDYYKGSAHGGTWSENIVSGFSRDILAEAMKRVEAAGYKIILTVHDEIVAEMRDGHGSLKEFQRLIEIVPGWAPGLPIMAKVREGTRWSKPDKAKTAVAQVESAAVAQIEVKSAVAAPEPESAPASGAGTGVLLAIAPVVRVKLRDLGYGAAAITRMTPAQAKAAIEGAFAPIPELPPRRRSPASPAGCADPLHPPPEAPPAAPEPHPGPLRADREQIAAFVQTLFKRARAGIVNLRTYEEGKAGAAKGITPIQIAVGDSVARFDGLIAAATQAASQAARSMIPLVFSPPVCVFAETAGWHAREEDLAEGVVLTVECDARPSEARSKLESVLGPATMIVASGGTWINGGSTPEDKLHLHWRLAVPARGDDLPRLKEARRLAAAMVGADVSSVPIVHPLRWPGSWHRKKAPRLCKIVVNNADREINLDIALSTLRAAAVANNVSGADTSDRPRAGKGPSGACWGVFDDLIDHAKLASAAMSLANAGMHSSPGAIYNLLKSEVEKLDPTSEEDCARKERRLYELRGIVNSAVAKAKARIQAQQDAEEAQQDTDERAEEPEPQTKAEAQGRQTNGSAGTATTGSAGAPITVFDPWQKRTAPAFPDGVLPPLLQEYVDSQSAMIGTCPSAMAMSTLTACSGALHHGFTLRQLRNSPWAVRPRLWTLLVGSASFKKTPPIDAATDPLRHREARLTERHMEVMAAYARAEKDPKATKAEIAAKAPKAPPRYLSWNTTTEALGTILAANDGRGILAVHDELSGWIGSMDRYHHQKSGDRGWWLKAYDGGPLTVDRSPAARSTSRTCQ